MVGDPGPQHVAPLLGRRDEMRDRLVRLADVNSGSLNPAGLALVRDALRTEVARLPAHVEEAPVRPGVSALVARAHPQAPVRVLLCGHYDTVFGPDDPFQRTTLLDPSRLTGPGVIDMKGGIVVMLSALEALEASPWAGGLGWEVLLVPDEELGSPGSAPLIEQAARRSAVGLVFEPGFPNGDVVRNRLGSGTFRMVAQGRAAHSGRDFGDGRNAVVALARVATAAHALNDGGNRVIVNVARLAGGGPVNVVPDRAEVEIGVRAASAADADRVTVRLREIADAAAREHGVAIEVEGRFHRPPRVVDDRWDALFDAYRRAAADLGQQVGWVDAGGSSDANLLTAAGLPTLDGLGPQGTGMHSPEETCLLDSLPRRAAAAALFLMRLAAGTVPLPAVR
jgi:glutamate carboxypeptidase